MRFAFGNYKSKKNPTQAFDNKEKNDFEARISFYLLREAQSFGLGRHFCQIEQLKTLVNFSKTCGLHLVTTKAKKPYVSL